MTRLPFSLSLAALCLASIGSTACITHTIVRPEPTVTFEKTCAKTACDAVQEATPALTPECKRCISDWVDGCSYAVWCEDSEVVCADDCRKPACADPTACVEYKWVAHVAHFTATPGVAEACTEANVDLSTRCGAPPTDDDRASLDVLCAQVALVSTEAAVGQFACLATTTDCKTFQDHCDQASTFGDDYCATRAASCGTGCSDPERASLNETGAGLKPEFLAAAQFCARQTSCDDAAACLDAWRKAI